MTAHPQLSAQPFDAGFHGPDTVANRGGCSWHGHTCTSTPVISFVDASGGRQSGCERAHRELVARWLMTPLAGIDQSDPARKVSA